MRPGQKREKGKKREREGGKKCGREDGGGDIREGRGNHAFKMSASNGRGRVPYCPGGKPQAWK